MQYAVVGILGSYGEGEAAVGDLELIGLRGEEVEIIRYIDEDARTANTPGEPITKADNDHRSRIARLLGKGGPLEDHDVHDLSGEQPNYIGRQEFYANHLKEGGVIVVVRTPAELQAQRAAAILRDHGGRTPGREDGPVVRQLDASLQ